ncbi:ATP-binding cassette domain-containing protein [Magnetococcus sp. PR-3]|uniref:ATP-binding cassette domain-containing protein n=1 Tax=Magnetococcus sp. PR-3 TaxID=3120355 RepID=UPI002FCE2DF4
MQLSNFLKKRFTERPTLTVALIFSSLLVSVLALTSPLFVMLVLNRYVVYGVDGTLWTLSSGAAIAILLEWGFRKNRLFMAEQIIDDGGLLAGRAISLFTKARSDALSQVPEGRRQELLQGLDSLEVALNPNNLVALLDLPFAVLSLFVLYLMSPQFAIAAGAVLVLAILISWVGYMRLKQPTAENEEASASSRAIVQGAAGSADTIRVFNGADTVATNWSGHRNRSVLARRFIQQVRGGESNIAMALGNIMGLALTIVGAIGVVSGDISVGAMIGAGILGRRAMQPVTQVARMAEPWQRAKQGLAHLDSFGQMPMESSEGMALEKYHGTLTFKDTAFMWAGETTPLFESLDFTLQGGEILVVLGSNGAGKTTLARMMAGLIPPVRGQILADETEVRQFSPHWWRKQLFYFPQDPALINGTVRSNILMGADDLEPEVMKHILHLSGLDTFIRGNKEGLELEVQGFGHNLSLGMRRRIALARALVVNGPLVIMDEPVEGLDAQGKERVFDLIQQMVNMGKSLVILTSERGLIGNAHWVLDLDEKPKPRLSKNHSEPA